MSNTALHGRGSTDGLEVDRHEIDEYKKGATEKEREHGSYPYFALHDEFVDQHRVLSLLVLDSNEGHQEKAEPEHGADNIVVVPRPHDTAPV
jgi:hypothetical protein